VEDEFWEFLDDEPISSTTVTPVQTPAAPAQTTTRQPLSSSEPTTVDTQAFRVAEDEPRNTEHPAVSQEQRPIETAKNPESPEPLWDLEEDDDPWNITELPSSPVNQPAIPPDAVFSDSAHLEEVSQPADASTHPATDETDNDEDEDPWI
jgi:hypothetical protein